MLVTWLTARTPAADENATPPKLPTGIVLVRFSGLTPAFIPVTPIVTVQLALEFTPTVAPGSDPPLTVKDAAPATGTGVNASVPGGSKHVPPVVTGVSPGKPHSAHAPS